MICLANVGPSELHKHSVSHLHFDGQSISCTTFDADTWRDRGKAFRPDVVIIEDFPSKLDALVVLRDLRAQGSKVPTMAVSANRSMDFVVRALDAGADDSLILPVSAIELQARVRALARRETAQGNVKLIKLGPLTLDPNGMVVRINDQVLRLTSHELALLEVFAEHPGRLVNKNQLMNRLTRQGEFNVSLNAIEVYIHRLRKKLKIHSMRISTVRSLGYCLESGPAAS